MLSAGLGAFAIYAWDRVSGSVEDLLNNPDRAWLARYSTQIKWLAVFSYVAAVAVIAQSDLSKVPYVLVPGLAGALYTIRVGPYRPKDLPGLKTFIVASATAISYGGLIGGPVWIYLLAGLINSVDTTISDIRDIEGDRVAGVRTMPVLLGRQRTLAVLVTIDLCIAYFSLAVAAYGAF